MKRNKKILVFAILFVAIIALSSSQPLLADVGNSGGFGGGSSGGGSFGGGGSGGNMFFFGGFGGGLGTLLVIGYIAFVMYSKYKGGSGDTSSGRGNENSRFNTTDLSQKEANAVQMLQESDPNFSPETFKSYVGEVYLIVQEAWEAKDWKVVRPVESNELFNLHNRQLKEYIDAKKTNYLNMQDVRKVNIAEYYTTGQQEVVVVRLNAVLLDYTTDDETGKVLDGSKTQYQERSYRLEFVRALGVKTSAEKGLDTANCPNCGAPTSVTSSGECEYCHSVITNGSYGWVLNKYGAWH